MAKILVPLKASAHAESVARVGIEIAKKLNGEVSFLNIVDTALLRRAGGEVPENFVKELKKIGKELLSNVKNSAEKAGVKARSKLKEGDTAKEILIGSSPGSISYKIAEYSTVPVLVVKKETGLRNFLVCTEGKAHSVNAIKVSGKIAKATDGDVTILYVVPKIPEVYEAQLKQLDEMFGLPAVDHEKNLREGKEILRKMGVHARTKLAEGDVAEEIIKEAEDGKYNLVIIGTRGRGKIKTTIAGSVSYTVAEYSKVPVLLVKKNTELKNALLCTDGSRHAEEAINYAGRLAKSLGAKTTLLSVAPTPVSLEEFYYTELPANAREELRRRIRELPKPEKGYLERGREVLRKIGVEAKAILIEGDVVDEILKEAAEYDFVALGSRGLGKLSRLVMGHVSLKVLSNAKTNVLIVRNCKLES